MWAAFQFSPFFIYGKAVNGRVLMVPTLARGQGILVMSNRASLANVLFFLAWQNYFILTWNSFFFPPFWATYLTAFNTLFYGLMVEGCGRCGRGQGIACQGLVPSLLGPCFCSIFGLWNPGPGSRIALSFLVSACLMTHMEVRNVLCLLIYSWVLPADCKLPEARACLSPTVRPPPHPGPGTGDTAKNMLAWAWLPAPHVLDE